MDNALGNKLFGKGLTINSWETKTYPYNLQELNLRVSKLSNDTLIFNDDAEVSLGRKLDS